MIKKLNNHSKQSPNNKNGKKNTKKDKQQIFKKYDSNHVNELIDRNKFKQAFDIANEAVQRQEIQAYGDLARIYLFDDVKNVVKQNYDLAFKLATEGEKQNQPNSLRVLGVIYQGSYGVQENQIKAIELYQKAINRGNIRAYYNLGQCYLYGKGVDKSQMKAVQLFKKAAEQKDIRAIIKLAKCYKNGQGVQKDQHKAFQLLTSTAEKKYLEGYNELGRCYYFGYGVQVDYQMAVYWWSRSAEQGDEEAQFNLAKCYQQGISYKNLFYQTPIQIYRYI